MTAWIYFIAGGGRTKIGWAERSPERRLRTLQLASPVPLRLVWTAAFDRELVTWLERRLHEAYAERRAHGEWFEGELTEAECRAAVQRFRYHGRAIVLDEARPHSHQ